MRTSEARKRIEEAEDARRDRVESFARTHERKREIARAALGHLMTCPSFDDADALLLALEDEGGALVVPS